MDHSNRNSIKTVQARRKKIPRKDIKELQKICKRLREEYLTKIELHEKILIFERIKILKEHITEKYKGGRSKRINRITQEIWENVDNGDKIWEPKRGQVKNSETTEILEMPENFFRDFKSEFSSFEEIYKTSLQNKTLRWITKTRDCNTGVFPRILWNFLRILSLKNTSGCGCCTKDLILPIFCKEKSFKQIFFQLSD